MRRAFLCILLVPALTLLAPDAGLAATGKNICERTTAHFTASRALNPREARRKLEQLGRKDATCFDAVRAAYRTLIAHWNEAVAAPSLAHSKRTIEANWRRFHESHLYLKALAAFRRASVYPDVLVAMGKHYEAMATYYNETGHMPDGIVVTQTAPESLYHQRAVDAAEDLLTRAETAYGDALKEMNLRGTDLGRMAEVRDLYMAIRKRHAVRAQSDAKQRVRAIQGTEPLGR